MRRGEIGRNKVSVSSQYAYIPAEIPHILVKLEKPSSHQKPLRREEQDGRYVIEF